MVDGPEKHGLAPDPWQLGEDLIQHGERMQRFLLHRDLFSPTTLNKTVAAISELAATYDDVSILVDAPLMLMPTPDGMGVGVGLTRGEIVGFQVGEYPTISEEGAAGPIEKGLIMLVATLGMNDTLAEDAVSWRASLLPAGHPSLDRPAFIVGIPLRRGIKVCRLSDDQVMPGSVAELLEAREIPQKPFEYMEDVNRIDALTGRKVVITQADLPAFEAMRSELYNMVDACPYLGQAVRITSDCILTPKPTDPDNFLLLRGSIQGVLRKFVVDKYQFGDTWFSGVQAVVYPPEVAQRVYRGELTAQAADRLYGTARIPLSLPHKLEVLTD